MLRYLGRWIRRRAQENVSLPVESFGERSLPRALGLEILQSSPERRNFLQGIRDALPSMSLEEKDELVDRVFGRLALLVFDLPDVPQPRARRFGLLDHLLAVAFQTARELSGPGFQVSPEPAVNHRESPRWAYAGVIASLAHALGQPLRPAVVLPETGETWDPSGEPLRLFCERHRLGGTSPEFWRAAGEPGDRSHGPEGAIPLGGVLTSELRSFLGARLDAVLQVLDSEEGGSLPPGIPEAAREVVSLVRRIVRLAGAGEEKPPGTVSPPAGWTLVREEGRRGARAKTEMFREGALPLVVSDKVPRPAELPAASGDARKLEPEFLPEDREDGDDRSRSGGKDPVENQRRLAHHLEPKRFLDLLRRMIVHGRFSRNNRESEVYVRPDFVWLVVPSSLRRLARINRLPYDPAIRGRMMSSLASSPQVEALDRSQIDVRVEITPGGGAVKAVRIRTPGFLSGQDLEGLGIYPFPVRVLPPGQAR